MSTSSPPISSLLSSTSTDPYGSHRYAGRMVTSASPSNYGAYGGSSGVGYGSTAAGYVGVGAGSGGNYALPPPPAPAPQQQPNSSAYYAQVNPYMVSGKIFCYFKMS